MIVTCASCLTKFNLDDSRVSPQGTKVRCSRCKHIFYVVPPPETQEEIAENFESFAKYHEDLIEPGQESGQEVKAPPPPEVEERWALPGEEEEPSLFPPKGSTRKVDLGISTKEVEDEVEARPTRSKRVARSERRGTFRILALIVVVALLVFGVFYVWTKLESGGQLVRLIESPLQQLTHLWNQVWGTEKEGLTVGDLSGYEETVGEVSLFVIEGKVRNQSRFNKRQVRIKVELFDQNKVKVAEKETLCGRAISRTELKSMPPSFFEGEMVIQPQTESERQVPSGKAIPFFVVFRDIPIQAKEFKVEIVEAPNQ